MSSSSPHKNAKPGSSVPEGPTISHITYPTIDAQPCSSSVEKESQLMDKRLWLGNLDPKLTEFHLLKLVQKYGPIEQFDFLFHRSGPNTGLPRGYAFVEFEDKESAEKCKNALNGKRISDRFMAIRWAHQVVKEYPDEQTKLRAKLPGLAVKESEVTGPKMNKEKAINAIEAKLMAMEREKGQMTLNISTNQPSTSSSKTPSFKNTNFIYKGYNNQSQHSQQNRYKQFDKNKKPYSR